MHGYMERAQRLAAGGPFYPFDTFYPPGAHYVFSLFYLLFGSELAPNALTYFQPALLAAANVLASLNALLLFQSIPIALLVGIACSLYWPFAALGSFFMAEPIFIFLLQCGFLLSLLGIRDQGSRKTFRLIAFSLSGVALGFATLCKSQGTTFFLTIALALFLFRSLRPLRIYVLPFAIFFIVPLALQGWVNSQILRKPVYAYAANDAFNMYLGQSKREAVGCLDRNAGTFYYFFNNNSAFDNRLLPPITLPVSILDRQVFFQRTLELWKVDPMLQIIRGLRSVRELFMLEPRWPLRNDPRLAPVDLVFQLLRWIIIFIPALFGIALSMANRSLRLHAWLLGFPLLLMAAIAFISQGEPRYLIPFEFNFFLFAALSVVAYTSGKSSSHSPLDIKLLPPPPLARSLTTTFIAGMVLVLSAYGVDMLYERFSPPRSDGSQSHYYALEKSISAKGEKPLYFAELGKNREIVTTRDHDSRITLNFEGFTAGNAWMRPVAWHISAENNGRLSISFPPNLIDRAELFFTDGDSWSRMSRAESGASDVIIDQIHDGRWFTLRFSAEEQFRGQAEITFTKLSGSDVSVSAIALHAKKEH